MPLSPLLTSEEQRRQQEDQQSQQQTSMATLYGGGGTLGYGGMYPGMFDQGMAPGYGTASGGGTMPKRDDAFTQFVSHMHGVGQLHMGRYYSGPYKGMDQSEAQEKMHDDWLNMSPEQRAPYASREFGADTVDANNPGGFFSKEQQNQVAPGFDSQFAALQGRVGGAAPAGDANFNPGSMGGSGPLANNDTRPHYGIGDSAASAGSQPIGPQRDAIPQGQMYQNPGGLASLPSVAAQNPTYVPSFSWPYKRMGNPNDTNRFGPKLSGGGAQPVTSWTAPVPQVPRYDTGGTLISPGDSMGSTGRVTDPRQSDGIVPHPQFASNGVLMSPGDRPGYAPNTNSNVMSQMPQRPAYSGPVPSPIPAMTSVR